MGFAIRVEEYHVAGAVTLGLFKVDKSEFVGFSPDYDDPFETDFQTKVDAVANIVKTKFYISELTGLTDSLENNVNLIYKKVNLLERYIVLAKEELTKSVDLFGLKNVRQEERSGNVEALGVAFVVLFTNVDANLVAIKNHGLTDLAYDELKALATTIATENDEQEIYKTSKSTAIEENWVVFTALLDVIKNVQATGKALFKGVSQAKVDGYAMSVLLDRVRQESEPPVVPPVTPV